MKNYLLSVYQPEGTPPPPDALEKIMAELGTLRDEMKATGAWVFSGGLNAPSTATVLRYHGGDVLMTDGPFTEGKEYLGGFTIVKAPDLDSARIQRGSHFTHRLFGALHHDMQRVAEYRGVLNSLHNLYQVQRAPQRSSLDREKVAVHRIELELARRA